MSQTTKKNKDMENSKEKIAIYLRVSTVAQDYDRQLKDLTNWCNGRYDIAAVFEDKLSGFDTEREGFNALKEYVIANNIKQVITWEFSRLGRKQIFLLQLCEWFEKNKIQLFCYSENFSLLDQTGKISDAASWVITIKAKVVQAEAATIKDRMMSGKLNRKKQGYYTGGFFPTGYTINEETRKIEIDPTPVVGSLTHADIINEIFVSYSTGENSCKQIAKNCLFKNYPKYYCHSGNVQIMLANPAYMGVCREQVLPAIVSTELFNKCREVATSKKAVNSYKDSKYIYLCGKKILCPECGKIYYNHQSGYHCGSTTTQIADRCNATSIGVNLIDSITWYIVCKNMGRFEHLFKTDNEGMKKQIEEHKVKISAIEEQVEELQKTKKKYNKLFMADGISETEYNRNISEVNASIRSLEGEITTSKLEISNLRKLIEDDKNNPQKAFNEWVNTTKITDRNKMKFYITNVIEWIKVHRTEHRHKRVIECKIKGEETPIYVLINTNKRFTNELRVTNSIGMSVSWDKSHFLIDGKEFTFDEIYPQCQKYYYETLRGNSVKK